MKTRQNLKGLALALAALGTFIPNNQLSAQTSNGIPESRESYIGKHIGDYLQTYSLDKVATSITPTQRV